MSGETVYVVDGERVPVDVFAQAATAALVDLTAKHDAARAALAEHLAWLREHEQEHRDLDRSGRRLVATKAAVVALPVGAVLIDVRGVPWTKARRKRGGSGQPPVGWRSYASPYYESHAYIATRGPLAVAYLPGAPA